MTSHHPTTGSRFARILPCLALIVLALLLVFGLVSAALYFGLLRDSVAIDDFHFAPGMTSWNPLPEKPAEVLRFAVIGDFGVDNANERYVAEMIRSWQPEFIVTTGDNNYPDGEASTMDANVGRYFHDYIAPYQGRYGEGADDNRFFPILGNHDWNADNARPYLDYFTLPGNERYYDFVWGPVHIFALDSSPEEPDGWTAESVQAQWLKERMASSDSPWKLVFTHISPYSSGKRGSTPTLQWPYQEWGASAVLSGHDHVYERIMRDDFPYFVTGLGGAKIYDFEETVEGSASRYNRMHGALLVEVTPERIEFQFYSIDNGGTLIDSYTINRPAGIPGA